MFPQIRRLLKHSAVYGLGHVVSRVVSFILLPFLTHSITPEQYGAMTLLYTFTSIALVVFIYGADIAFLRFYIPEKDPQKRKEIFGTVFWSSLLTTGVFSVIIALTTGALAKFVFNDPDSIGAGAGYLIILSAGILFADTLSTFPYLWLRSVEKSLPFIVLKGTGALLHVGLTILFVNTLNRGIAGIFEANLIASSYQLAMLLPVIIKNTGLTLRWATFRELFKFGLPNMPSQIFVMVIELSDRKILEVLAGLTVVGIYSAGYKLGLFMAVITMGFRFAWQPFFLSIADKPDAKETFARVFTYFLLVTGVIFLALVFVLAPLMKMELPVVGTMIEERYWEGLKVFPVILLAHICNGAYANFMVGVYLKKKTGLMPLVTGVAALVNLGVNLLFIPIFGMMAAAWAHFLSHFVLAGLLYLLIQRHYPVKYEWNRIGILIACGGFVYLLSLAPFLSDYWFLKLLLLPLFVILLKVTNFFLPEEIAAVRRRLFPSRIN
jgi:O-antigen/teichoic acid export membrane protein